MRVLVTGGPTREFLDDVRFLSNPSTGAMGIACARAAARAGHRVVLVLGPSHLPDPPGVRTIRVTTALEMHAAAMAEYPACDAVLATAAVSDYRPARRHEGKVKKGRALVPVALVPNPDILAGMGRAKGRRILVGFALESRRGREGAIDKLRRKNLDHVVLDSPAAFGADRIDAVVIHAAGGEEEYRGVTKAALARDLVALFESPAPAGRKRR